MIVVRLLFFISLASPNPAWSLTHSSPAPFVSSTSQLKGDELLRIGEIHDHQRHFPEALTYYQLALSTFREKKQSHGVATALVKIAQVYERQGKFPDAFVALQEAVPIFARSSDRIAYARALLVLGRISARLGQIEEARTSLSQAVILFDRAKERRGWNESSIQLGLLNIGDDFIEPGLSLLQRAWEDARARQDREQQLAAIVALGNAYRLLDRGKETRQHYDEGLRLAEKERNMAIEAAIRLRLAQLDAEEGRLTEGIELGKRALVLAQTVRDPVTEAAVSSLLADLYRKMDRSAEAEEAEQRALSIYRQRQILVHGAR